MDEQSCDGDFIPRLSVKLIDFDCPIILYSEE